MLLRSLLLTKRGRLAPHRNSVGGRGSIPRVTAIGKRTDAASISELQLFDTD